MTRTEISTVVCVLIPALLVLAVFTRLIWDRIVPKLRGYVTTTGGSRFQARSCDCGDLARPDCISKFCPEHCAAYCKRCPPIIGRPA